MEVARLRGCMAYESGGLWDKDECCVCFCDYELPLSGSTSPHFVADDSCNKTRDRVCAHVFQMGKSSEPQRWSNCYYRWNLKLRWEEEAALFPRPGRSDTGKNMQQH